MKYRKWSPEDVKNLLSLPLEVLLQMYPDQNRQSLQTLKRYYKNKLKRRNAMETDPQLNQEGQKNHSRLDKIAELLERSGIDLDSVQKVNRVNVYQSAMKDEEGEWSVQDLYSVQYVPKPEEPEYEPATPAKITPTRRKAPKREHKLILVYGDGQVDYRRIIDHETGETELVPLHDEAMHNILKQVNADLMPDYTVNLGDFADMAALSRFDPDSDHFHKTLAPSMQYIHNFYAQLVADNPSAAHIEVDSNHAVRPKKQVLNNMPALHDFYRPGEDYPLMTYYSLANLGKLGIQFISGYGAAEYVHGEEYGRPIIFKHGTHSSSSPGATVRKEAAENPEVNVVRAHGHHHEEVRRTTRNGDQLFYIMVGSSCNNKGTVPGYHSAVDDFNRPVETQLNHQNTFLMIEDYENGHYNVTSINVIKGIAYYMGKEYNGNE
jgi:hypothetical protein